MARRLAIARKAPILKNDPSGMASSTQVHLIAAARPNFMKVAPLYHALASADGFEPVVVHTGQHYDPNMSDHFFRDLGLPKQLFLGPKVHSMEQFYTCILISFILLLRHWATDHTTLGILIFCLTQFMT